MKNCPDCGTPVDGLTCPKCSSASVAAAVDPLRWKCCYTDRGLRCAKLGRFTSSTLGTESWFCEEHYPPFRNREAFNPISMPDKVRAQLRAAFPGTRIRAPAPVDFEAIAERIAIEQE